MAQIINTNMVSLNAQRNLSTTNADVATAVQRLSSGLRVNSAKDDAAGIAIAERMQSQIKGMNVAIRNANDGISFGQVAEGALGKMSDMLQRMRELAVQSANGTNSDGDRANLDLEYQQLATEISRTVQNTRFNGYAVLAALTAHTFHIGAGNDANDRITMNSSNMTTEATMTALFSFTTPPTIPAPSNILTQAASQGVLPQIDAALTTINSERANFGAIQNRFEAVIENLQVAAENQTAARSRIMDADFAAETAALTRAQVLQQAGTAMLAQANQLPNNVLQLLQR
ncbi:MAG: flagellin FliC [Burkholderiaceae bacterium]|nr:flagellin FliC [Burkholderiaceae bacterium]